MRTITARVAKFADVKMEIPDPKLGPGYSYSDEEVAHIQQLIKDEAEKDFPTNDPVINDCSHTDFIE